MLRNSSYFLHTDRLGFRLWSLDDVDLAFELWGDREVTRLIDAHGLLSRQQVRERILRELANADSCGVQYWPIFLLSNDEHAGCCGLRPYDLSKGIFEIGFQIRPRFWRQGYALEAARAVMSHAFDTLEVDSLFAGHHPKNEASAHLLKKLGFHYSHDEFYAPTGLNHPSYLMTAVDYLRQRDEISE